jgi:hypothetical protein
MQGVLHLGLASSSWRCCLISVLSLRLLCLFLVMSHNLYLTLFFFLFEDRDPEIAEDTLAAGKR